MKYDEVRKLMIHSKYKELLGLLETFNLRLDVWEFQLVLVNHNNEKVASIDAACIKWEEEL